MHILVLTDEIYPDAIGGVAKTLYNECTALLRLGHQVSVVVRGLDQTLPPEEIIDGIHITRLFGPARSSPFYYFYGFSSIINFSSWLKSASPRFDVIYASNPLLLISTQLAGIHRNIPIAYTFFAPMFQEILIGVTRGKYGILTPLAWAGSWILKAVETMALSKADQVLPRSEYSQGVLRGFCPDAVVYEPLIPLGVDIRKFAPQDRADARQALQLPPKAKILLTVRRLAYRMGLQNLISAMGTIRETHPGSLLLIAGKGPLRAALEEQIASSGLQDNVHLLGLVSEAELPLYLGAADLFVLPTQFLEGFGLATLEALSSGRPVLGTPNGATPELLGRIDASLLTRDASPEAISEGVCYWLDRQDTLPELGDRCRQEVENRYDIDSVAPQLEARFQEMILTKMAGLSSKNA